MKYKANTVNRTCFGVSLVNLLIYLGDCNVARGVSRNYRFSPLVRNNGDIHPALMTRAVADLTIGLYGAILHTNWGVEPSVNIRRDYKNGFDTPDVDYLLDIVKQETKAGRIVGSCGGQIRIKEQPTIITIEGRSGEAHAVVSLGKGHYIDGGRVVDRSYFDASGFNVKPLALLEVVRKGRG